MVYVQRRDQVAFPGDQKHAGFVKLNVDKRSRKQGTSVGDYLTLVISISPRALM